LEAESIVLWSVFFLVPVGRAAGAPRLNAADCEAAFERLRQQSQVRTYRIKTTEAPHFRRFLLQKSRQRGPRDAPRSPARLSHFSSLGINDGKGIMFVSHLGLIYPSGFLPINCGVFPRDHLVQVYQEAPLFRALRDADRLEGKCRVCEYRNICGGSRARAFAVTDNPMAEEPDCAHLPSALEENPTAARRTRRASMSAAPGS
jgi:radical SAM protein with 4Fe4S-binding SPASM domain